MIFTVHALEIRPRVRAGAVLRRVDAPKDDVGETLWDKSLLDGLRGQVHAEAE